MPIRPRITTALAAAVTVLAASTAADAQAPGSTLNIRQTSVVSNLYPGGPPQGISGVFDNTGSGPVHVDTVNAAITSITGPNITPSLPCTTADFQLNGFPVAVGSDVPVGIGVGAWAGGSIQMLNTPFNQNGCQQVTVTVEFTAATSAVVVPPADAPGPLVASRKPIGLTISQRSGSTAGGDRVVITGEDFADGASVLFGDVPATDVVVDRFDRLTAAVPPHTAGDVVLRIVTRAGISDPFGPYTYASPQQAGFGNAVQAAGSNVTPAERCVVPRLRGLSVAAARTRLADAHCRVGRVARRAHRGRPGVVVAQWTRAATNLPTGAAVSVTVAKAPRRR